MRTNFKTIEIPVMKPLEELESFSKLVSKEGLVLLENKKNVLPIVNKKIAVFGRIQTNYYKSGTGSGGLVNVKKVNSIIDELLLSPRLTVDLNLYQIYKNWIEENPFNEGSGQWASEPWSQVEMELTDETVKAYANHNDVSIVIFGRTAGEDRDNFLGEGSCYLTKTEELLLKQVSTYSKRTVVILNVGNSIDLSFMDKFNIHGLIYAWHGGIHGANALVDLITGYDSFSGKLPMTQIKNLNDYPVTKNFGHHHKLYYEEDIYVGYRYFETFDKDNVRYPFGYGLTYSNFKILPLRFVIKKTLITFDFELINIGNFPAKEVIQIYLEQPQGLLGKPKKVLVGFAKSKQLNPNEKTIIKISIDLLKQASFDDLGLIYLNSYVLEKGQYQFYFGTSLKDLKKYGKINLKDDLITQKSNELNNPNENLKILKPSHDFKPLYIDAKKRTVDYNQQIKNENKKPLELINQEYNLLDVYYKKITLDDFIQSLNVDQLIELTRGEGMSSPKVTSGTAAAFGGLSDELLAKGIPIACLADGPSGIRMDSGLYATSLPIGTLIGATFNTKIVEDLYYLTGLEMRAYQVDMLLGPGMNIQRHPLNGRNFEYYSEDPLLTGMMGAAATIGLNKAGVGGTLKHVFANNQETDRFNVDAVISQRAQREIYLKGFEIAVKMSNAKGIMTSYNPVNGLWTASNYDINKKLIHDEWNFDGIIVTDWWAKMNDFNESSSKTNTKAMIISQNDLYMVISDAKSNSGNDNSKVSYLNNELLLSHLQITARHILKYLLETPAFYKLHNLDFIPSIRSVKPWFNVKKVYDKQPKIKSLVINQEKVLVKPNQTLINLDSINQISSIYAFDKKIEINQLKNHAVILNKDNNLNNVHVYINSNKNNENNIFFENKHVDYKELNSNEWTENIIDFSQYIHKSEEIKVSNTLAIDHKNEFITYAFNFNKDGKYIFEFNLKTESKSLAQIPFSIYIDGLNKSTLTIQGTDNIEVITKAFILIEKGNHLVTFKFNKAGIIFNKVKILRHG